MFYVVQSSAIQAHTSSRDRERADQIVMTPLDTCSGTSVNLLVIISILQSMYAAV